MNLDTVSAQFQSTFEVWLKEYLAHSAKNSLIAAQLLESQTYTLSNGGKRFRPLLSYLVFQLFSQKIIQVRSLCLALEMIHSYSLIHDDLPCMDNDDVRRGKPSNHKVFGESLALLAGDGLLTDAFSVIADDNQLTLDTRLKLVSLVARQTGSFGMVSGQVHDMTTTQVPTLEKLKLIHNLKTANLIETATAGAAIVANASVEEMNCLMNFGHALGMAFQIQDDLLDHEDKSQDFKSFVSLLGIEKTKNELESYTANAVQNLDQLKKFGRNTSILEELCKLNLKRTV